MTPVALDTRGDTAEITFLAPERGAPTLDEAALEALEELLGLLEESASLSLVLFRSVGEPSFLTGPPPSELDALADAERAADYALRGQELLARLRALPARTVALLGGHCLGVGLELALSCDLRLAASDRPVQLGFPEGLLGMVPAWGGLSRLVARVGPMFAIELLQTGAALPAPKALEAGLIDAIVPADELEERARTATPRAPRWSLLERLLRRFPPMRVTAMSRSRALAQRLAPDEEQYPAPRRRQRLVELALSWPEDELLEQEREAYVRTLCSPGARRLRAHLLARARIQGAARERVGSGARHVGALSLGAVADAQELAARARGVGMQRRERGAAELAFVAADEAVPEESLARVSAVLVELGPGEGGVTGPVSSKSVGYRFAPGATAPRIVELSTWPETDPGAAATAVAGLERLGFLPLFAGSRGDTVAERLRAGLSAGVRQALDEGADPATLAGGLAFLGIDVEGEDLPQAAPAAGGAPVIAALRPCLVEAARVLAAGVIDDPETIDFVAVHAAGFSAWRGGPFALATELGPELVQEACASAGVALPSPPRP